MKKIISIQPDWLEITTQGRLLYQCSGHDIEECLGAFHEMISDFWFCDPVYRGTESAKKIMSDLGYHFITVEGDSPPFPPSEMRGIGAGCYPHVPKAVRSELFERSHDGRRVKVNWRRGFGEYMLHEQASASVTVFMHRGDSPGEGGSNRYFFSSKGHAFPPIPSMIGCLRDRLSTKAIIVTDGSNCNIGFLKRWHGKDISPTEAAETAQQKSHQKHGLAWTCIGHVGKRCGPALAWGVERQ
jgi:hypothetical protein